MTDAANDFDVRTVSGVIDACRRGATLERQHSFLVFLRDGLNRSIAALEAEIARRRTPVPRRPSGTLPAVEGETKRHPSDDR